MRIQFYVSIKLKTKQFKSNESQGDLERLHQTLKKYDENILIRQSNKLG
jgi:hypothetical protein